MQQYMHNVTYLNFFAARSLLKYPSSPLQSTHIDAPHKTGLQCYFQVDQDTLLL